MLLEKLYIHNVCCTKQSEGERDLTAPSDNYYNRLIHETDMVVLRGNGRDAIETHEDREIVLVLGAALLIVSENSV